MLPPRSSCSATSGWSRTRSRRCRRPCSRERRCPMTRRLPARRAFPEAACASRSVRRSRQSIAARAVITDAGERIGYDALVLATGSINRVLPMFPAGQKGIYYLRTEAEARALKARLHQGGSLLVIGGGLIGLEVAASAAELGVKTSVVEIAPRILARVCNGEISALI